MTPRVLLLGPYPPPWGGVQTHVVALRRFLRERGIAGDVVNLHRHRTAIGEGIRHPRTALEAARLLARLEASIVHLHIGGTVTPRLLALVLYCTLLPRRRTVLTFHSGGYPTSSAGRTAGPLTLRSLVFRRLDRVIAVNPAIVRLFQRFGLAPERVRLISPFAMPDTAPAAALPAPLSDFAAVHRPLLLTVGLLEPEYDLPLQIEALGRVRERFPKAGLVILGSGSLHARLRDAIAATPHAEAILLYGDAPHPVTLRAIADSDLLLRTTWYDGDELSDYHSSPPRRSLWCPCFRSPGSRRRCRSSPGVICRPAPARSSSPAVTSIATVCPIWWWPTPAPPLSPCCSARATARSSRAM